MSARQTTPRALLASAAAALFALLALAASPAGASGTGGSRELLASKAEKVLAAKNAYLIAQQVRKKAQDVMRTPGAVKKQVAQLMRMAKQAEAEARMAARRAGLTPSQVLALIKSQGLGGSPGGGGGGRRGRGAGGKKRGPRRRSGGSKPGSLKGGKATNVYTTYHYYSPNYETSSLYCADVFWSWPNLKPLLDGRAWTAYCNDGGLGPMSQDKCGKTLCVNNPATGQTTKLVVVDMCGQGGIDVDPIGFNRIDKNKAGVRDGNMRTTIWWC